ncbi:MAG: oxidoreductase [Bacteroidota bacterium]|jgi:NAD(P)-dependent dehydrogenase (short-subunit alcohol dehydrogenase family)
MFAVKDKVIVVTGGNGLLGKEIISSLRNRQAIAISADIKFDHQLEDDFILDITNEDSVKSVVANIVKKYGRIDGWVNNAYPRTGDWGKKLEDIPFESWRRNVDMHLNGYYLCCQVVLEHMKLQQFGSLINMSSIYGMVAPDFSIYEGTTMTMPAAYSAIKGGINNLSKYLASYYGHCNVRVNIVSPGGIFDSQPDAFVNKYNKKVPLKRMGQPNDIIGPIHFLLSDDSSYITGHNLVVDGGLTIV